MKRRILVAVTVLAIFALAASGASASEGELVRDVDSINSRTIREVHLAGRE